MPYALNGTAHVYYEVDGQGPPLILHHGFTSGIRDWHEFGWVDALRHEYRLILIDARGHGKSDKPHDSNEYRYELLAADVLAIMDKLHIEQAHFFGYSWGTDIGCTLAQMAPQRLWSLVLGGMVPFSRADEAWANESRIHFGSGMAAHMEKYLFPPGRIITPEFKVRHLSLDPQALIAVATAGTIPENFLVDILPKLDLPRLVYSGENDDAQQVADVVAQIPGVRFFSLPGLGHGQGFRYSHQALPQILEFLREVTPRAEQNRAVVQRVVRAINSANYAGLEQYYHPEWTWSGEQNPQESHGIQHLIQQIFSVFADAHAEIEEVVADDEKVTTRWIFKGTHTGEWKGIAPTGTRVRVSGILVDHIANGKIIESHVRYEPADLQRQLAIAPEQD